MNRMNTAAAICLLIAGMAGCDDKNNSGTNTSGSNTGSHSTTSPSTTTPRSTTTTPPAPDATRSTTNSNSTTTTTTTPHEPDNTANNKRDRNNTQTPMDQSNDKTDIDISAKIRSTIVGDKNMSTNAQNCKIITNKGVVTLRGVVNSEAEKAAVEQVAKSTAGVTSVDNQLEVAPPSK